MKYSKEDRELAAQILQMVASNDPVLHSTTSAGAWLGLPDEHPAVDLAYLAFTSDEAASFIDGWRTMYAEAEAMVREGWAP